MKLVLLVLVLMANSFGEINKYWHVTTDGTGDRTTGTSWTGGESISLDTLKVATLTAGDVIFVKGGSYTLGSATDWSATNGTAIAPIALIGVKATTTNVGANIVHSDWAVNRTDDAWLLDSADLPQFNLVTYQFKVGNYYNIYNFKFFGDALNLVATGTVCNVRFCIFNETAAASSTRKGLVTGTFNTVIACAFYSTNASGLTAGAGTRVKRSLFYNIPDATNGVGVLVGGNSVTISSCIFKNIGNSAVVVASTDYGNFSDNTFFKCATDFSITDGFGNLFENNLHDSTVADCYKATTQTDINVVWNNFCGNGVADCYDGIDSSTVFMDYRVRGGNSGFTSSVDLSLSASSDAKNVGAAVRTVVK